MPATGTISDGATTREGALKDTRFDAKDAKLLLLLGLIAGLMFIPFLGAAGMFDPTDSFFIESAREMLETNKLIVPMINYEPWLDKPAFAFWFIVQSFKAFGVNEFAGRFSSALCGILLVLCTFTLTRHILSRRQSFLCALTLAASPLFVIVGHVSLIDEPLALFLTIALLSIANYIALGKKQFLLTGYVSMCVAALCKGPLALVLIGLITVGYFLLTKPKKIVSSILSMNPLLAIGLLWVITVPYYVWAHIGTNGEFTNAFFLRQNLGRMVGVVNHVNPFWWYIPVVIGGFFPWCICALGSGKFLRRYIVRRAKLATPRQQLVFFCLCWATLGFLFFSAIPTKLQTYIDPIFPALAVVMGNYLDVLLRTKHSKIFKVATVLTTILVCAAPFLVHFLSTGPGLLTTVGYGASGVLILGLVALLIINRNKSCASLATLYGGIMVGCAVFLPLLFCLYHDKYQANVDKVVQYSKDHGAHLAAVQFEYPSIMFRYKEKIPLLRNQEDLQAYSDEPGKRWIFIPEEVLSLLSWTNRSPRVVGYAGKYWIFAIGKDALKEDTVEWNGLLPQFHYPTIAELESHHAP